MLLYLIRHAHAIDHEDDEARTLSEKGRAQVEAVAKFLRSTQVFTPQEMWHSPLVRARETAELLSAQLNQRVPLLETAGLRPEDSPERILHRLGHAGIESLALVGHEPHLSTLASSLIAHTSEPRFVFKKCAVLALEGIASYWRVRWHISPELLE